MGYKFINARWHQHTLGYGVDRSDDELAPRIGKRQLGQGSKPVRSGVQCRGCAVIGQAVPRRKFDNFQTGFKKTSRFRYRTHCCVVGRDKHRACAGFDRNF